MNKIIDFGSREGNEMNIFYILVILFSEKIHKVVAYIKEQKKNDY